MNLVILPKNKDDTVQLRSGFDFSKVPSIQYLPQSHRLMVSAIYWWMSMREAAYNRSRINDILAR